MPLQKQRYHIVSKTWNMYNKTGDAGQNGKWDSADSADFKMRKKGWKMSGKVANGKVTVVEYSKSVKGIWKCSFGHSLFRIKTVFKIPACQWKLGFVLLQKLFICNPWIIGICQNLIHVS